MRIIAFWGAWAFLATYFALSKLLPLLAIVWASLLPYFRYPSAAAFKAVSFAQFRNIAWDITFDGLKNTAFLMVLTPTVTLVIAVARSRG